MKLYNTLTRKIEEFKPLNPPKVGIYICGPTVYDYAHIGHARTYVNSDVLVRSLRWLDYQVKVVMNITDVGHLTDDADHGEDKLEKKAKEDKKNILDIAKYYTNDFWQMIDNLNINRPDVVTPATKYIQEMIELVKILEEKGFTYKTTDGVYFDTSKFKAYGKLAKLDLEGLKEGFRVEKHPEKKNPSDFALWKLSKEGEKRQLKWDSPWGKDSFPGWHIECSAMSMKHLGETLDIHTGGVDHIPVHHTNEIAQSEAATNKQFVKYWFHCNFLEVEEEKMSKSLKNFIRVSDLKKKGFDPLALRYLYLTSHYRTKMNFTEKSLLAARDTYDKLRQMTGPWQKASERTTISTEKQAKLDKFITGFKQAVENDLNMPQAMAVVWQMAKSNIPDYDKWDLISDWDQVLGLKLSEKAKDVRVPEKIEKLIEQRNKARKNQDFSLADKLRLEIESKGYEVEDLKNKTIAKLKKIG